MNAGNCVAKFCASQDWLVGSGFTFLSHDRQQKSCIKHMKPGRLRYWTSAIEGQGPLRDEKKNEVSPAIAPTYWCERAPRLWSHVQPFPRGGLGRTQQTYWIETELSVRGDPGGCSSQERMPERRKPQWERMSSMQGIPLENSAEYGSAHVWGNYLRPEMNDPQD